MWGASENVESQPVLKKMTKDIFSTLLSDYLDNQNKIVIFTEKKLNPEDLSKKDYKGQSNFPELLKQNGKYFHSVENPIDVIKKFKKNYAHVNVSSVQDEVNSGKSDAIFVDFDEMAANLRDNAFVNHDRLINKIYGKLKTKLPNLIVMYTGYSSSFASGDEQSKPTSFFHDLALVYVAGPIQLNKDFLNLNFSASSDNNSRIFVGGEDANNNITMTFVKSHPYWILDSLVLTRPNTSDVPFLTNKIRVGIKNSYHCAKSKFFAVNGKFKLSFAGFQVQPRFQNTEKMVFGKPETCTGYFGIGIITGLIISFLFIIIIFIGVYFMMEIKTNDRFDQSMVVYSRIEF
ncbi:unnamed protein product [Brassicogethes aeneus]|uniref:Uncharacterized protein n=1 Tax=Brassicogethes aeneus TaxID=1431903 RepID=A0A9P0B2L9_BRAAE|nr:unnamed protein product [Brassicogethes aeneus]